jgi:hypothetical protein
VGACDLGIFYQAVQGWAFHGWPYVAIKGYAQLGDHFSPMLALLAPLLWIYDSPLTLMLAQVLLVCLSAVPVYLAVQRRYGTLAASLLSATYLLSFGIQGALAFPVHEVMFAAPLVAWALERSFAGRWTFAAWVISATVLVKEDMGLTVAAFGVYALVHGKWRHAAALVALGLSALVISVAVIIPAMNPNGFTYSSDYAAALGGSSDAGSQVAYLFAHPATVFNTLFDNPIKLLDWHHLLIPVGIVALGSPVALVGLPTIVIRMLSSRDTEWSWLLYYDLPLMPIIYLGAVDAYGRWSRIAMSLWQFLVGKRLPRTRGLRLDACVAALLCGVAFFASLRGARSLPLYDWFFKGSYHSKPAWLVAVRQVGGDVPPDVAVQATNWLAIPLSARDGVTIFGSAYAVGDWAFVDTADPGCGVTSETADAEIARLTGEGWVTVRRDPPIVLLRRP